MTNPDYERLWDWMLEHERRELDHQLRVDARLSNIEQTLAKAAGGGLMLLGMGSVFTAIGAGIAWLLTYVTGIKIT